MQPKKLYQKVDIDLFQELLFPTQAKLSVMHNVEEMWELFTEQLINAVNKTVPVKIIYKANEEEPLWFNKEARKLVNKHRKTYNLFKKTSNPFYLKRYKEERRLGKHKLRAIKRNYLYNKICKPLELGNSKPFYRHLKWMQSSTKPAMKLIDNDDTITEEPVACANLLNSFFHKQFCTEDQLTPINQRTQRDNDNISITYEGVLKL